MDGWTLQITHGLSKLWRPKSFCRNNITATHKLPVFHSCRYTFSTILHARTGSPKASEWLERSDHQRIDFLVCGFTSFTSETWVWRNGREAQHLQASCGGYAKHHTPLYFHVQVSPAAGRTMFGRRRFSSGHNIFTALFEKKSTSFLP